MAVSKSLPDKLRIDAIVEALLDIRFDSQESETVPEVVVGRLADLEPWRAFLKKRLPIADVPAFIRSQDRGMRRQPLLELRQTEPSRLVKLGSAGLSFHALGVYPGWRKFRGELEDTVDSLFRALQPLTTDRLGLRYINVFTESDHGVSGVADLNYSIAVAKETLSGPQNLNYRLSPSPDHIVQVRIASPDFVSGDRPDLRALVDVDVFTPDGFQTDDVDGVKRWIAAAHDYEKVAFFALFTDAMIERLVAS